MFDVIIEGLAERGRAAQEARGMYVDEQGVTRCAVCHKPLRYYVQSLGREMPTSCDCDERDEADRRQREAASEARRRVHDSPLYDRNTTGVMFSDDAVPNSEAGKVCRAYVEQFEKMRRSSFGLMFTGTMGPPDVIWKVPVIFSMTSYYKMVCSLCSVLWSDGYLFLD